MNRALDLTPYLMPNPALREKSGLLRLGVHGPAHGQVRSSPTGWSLKAITTIDHRVLDVGPGVRDEFIRWDTVTYYAEEVAYSGRSWRTWRLSTQSEAEHIVAAMHTLIETVHELDVRAVLLQSGQDAVDSTT